MPLPTSGPLSLNDIQTEFGGTNPISINEYYAGGANVPAGTSGTNGPVPSSGQISIANFYGTVKEALGVTYTGRGFVSGAGFRTDVMDIAYGGTTFVAVGLDGSLSTATSASGTWTFNTALQNGTWGAAADVNAIAWNGSIFCIVGGGGRVATSPDGLTWTFQTGLRSTSWGTTRNATDIIWDGSKFVVVGALSNTAGDGAVATSTNGVTWTYTAIPSFTFSTINMRIAYNGTRYVITGSINTAEDTVAVRTSTDLITFGSITIPTLDDGISSKAIARSFNTFLMATTSRDGEVFSSTDGITWTSRTSLYRAIDNPGQIQTVYWSGTEFILGGGTSFSAESTFVTANTTATTFTTGIYLPQFSSSREIFAAIKVDGLYVLAGQNGVLCTSSALTGPYTQNTDFNRSNSSIYWTSFFVNDAAWNGSIYMIVGVDGQIATSSDGINWTYRTTLRGTSWGTTADVLCMTTNGSTFLVAGENGHVATTTDGVTWTYQGGLRATGWGTTAAVRSVIWTGSIYVAIGINVYATSPDGATWTYSATKFVRDVADTGSPTAMVWTGARLVVGSSTGYIYTSTTATTATPNLARVAVITGTPSPSLEQFIWNGSLVIAATSLGIYTSPSTFTAWTLRQSGNLFGVVRNSSTGQLVAVGINGTSFYSTNGTTWAAGALSSSTFGSVDEAYAVTTSGTQYVVGGTYGKIATSL